MTRRAALWGLFVVGIVYGGVLLAVDARLWDEGGPGIVAFELAWTDDQAGRILAEWGDEGRDAARLELWLVFPYMVGYGVFWTLAVRAARDLARRRRWETLARVGRLWPLGLVAAGLHFVENVCLHVALGGDGGAWLVVAGVFATLKYLALIVVNGYLAAVIVRRFPRAAAAAGAAVVVFLAVNAWIVDRETRPADPDIGRILDLPAGDIQVREDGPRDGRPLVLVHGFAVSMRWFDDVVPVLARDFRLIRIDLLGHGGSEKPREGYSMEEQAEVVAQVMRSLRIPRAAVVGHSMGGIVGTALVEEHPELVSRLMMIGTPPDDEDLEGGLLANAAFWPVIGHANHRFVSERVVRWVVEQGFAPEVDPPERLAHDIFERTTWSSFNGSSDAISRYWDRSPLQERLADEDVPVTVILGEEERHTKRSVALYNSIPGARTVVMEGLDHSPQVESPARTAPLIAAFARGG